MNSYSRKLLYGSMPLTFWIVSRPWAAGKHMESVGALAKELGFIDETVDSYRRASELFLTCGKVQPSADVLGRGARY